MTNPNPVSFEETPEMRGIHDFFKGIANRMVEASNMAQDFQSMRGDFDALRSDMDQLRSRNRELDQSVADIRIQRDTAIQEATTHRNEIVVLDNALRAEQEKVRNLESALSQSNVLVDNLRKERDDYGLKAMEQEERANRLEAQLKVITDAMAKVAEVTGQPAPTFLTPPADASKDLPKGYGVFAQAAPEPNPEPTMKRVYQNSPGWKAEYWNLVQRWDDTANFGAGEYYVEVPNI